MNDYDFDSSGFVFTEALRDVEAEQRAELLIRGKLAAAGFWPYLAEAASETEFGHRLALVEDRLAQLVPPAVLEPVQASLAADWKLLQTARLEERRAAARERGERIREHTAQAAAAQIQPDQEFFDQKSGSWVTAANSASGYTLPARYKLPEDLRDNQHAVDGYRDARYHAANDYDWRLADGDSFTMQHDDYQRGYHRAHDDLKAGSRHGKQAYLDPSDAQRYSAYPDLNPPVDNGPLQGPDGFVTDPQPDNSGASNAVIQQRQLTPGQWTVTPGTEWPVRPNAGDPSQVARTAAQLPGHLRTILQTGSPRWEFDALVTAYPHLRAFAGEGIVPTPGPNPNYFSQGSDGLAGPPSFPENPSGQIEPKTDNRIDDLYGAVPPQVSPGSAAGTADGQGYSRQAPGSSATAGRRPFDRTAADGETRCGECGAHLTRGEEGGGAFGPAWNDEHGRPNAGEPGVRESGWHWHHPAENRPPISNPAVHTFDSTGEAYDRSQTEDHIKDGDVLSVPREGVHGYLYKAWPIAVAHPGDPGAFHTFTHGSHEPAAYEDQGRYGASVAKAREVAAQHGHTGRRTAGFDDSHVTHYVGWARSQGKNPDDVETLKSYERQPGIGRSHTNFLADQLYIGSGDRDWRRQAATDGRIVGHCDHCRNPVRYHTNEQGVDELRHLHNNDNRCSNGQQATAKLNRVHAFYDPADPSIRVVAEDVSRTRPTLDNPSGAGDEFTANTWDNALRQRPLQSAEDRGINTPTQPRDPIPTIDSSPRSNDLEENRNQDSMARETSLHDIMEMS